MKSCLKKQLGKQLFHSKVKAKTMIKLKKRTNNVNIKVKLSKKMGIKKAKIAIISNSD